MNTISSKDIIYLIVPDRFACAEGNYSQVDVNRCNPNYWHGGNIKGIIEHLDYIVDLGVTTIWLTPILKNDNPIENGKYTSYHGYGVTDFLSVDPHFGTLDDYIELVNTAHEKGLKVVMDFVVNHCGNNHPWLKDESKKDWINNIKDAEGNPILSNKNTTTILGEYVSDYDKNQTIKGWFTTKMPDINLTNINVKNYFIDAICWWIENTKIDAIRMDTYQYSDTNAMQDIQNAIQLRYPGFTVIAETWVPNPAYTSKIQKECTIKGTNDLVVMDFAFQKAIDFAFSNKKEAEYSLYNHFLYDYLYDNPKQTLAFLDNHDIGRWFFYHNNIEVSKQAMAILLTVPRIPQILYGTELLFIGDGWDTGDGNWRNDFPGGWSGDLINKFNIDGRSYIENDFLEFTKRLLRWRKSNRALTDGKMKQYLPQNGVYVYSRYIDKRRVVVFTNLSGLNQKILLERYRENDVLEDVHSAFDIISGETIELKSKYLVIRRNQIIILDICVDV